MRSEKQVGCAKECFGTDDAVHSWSHNWIFKCDDNYVYVYIPCTSKPLKFSGLIDKPQLLASKPSIPRVVNQKLGFPAKPRSNSLFMHYLPVSGASTKDSGLMREQLMGPCSLSTIYVPYSMSLKQEINIHFTQDRLIWKLLDVNFLTNPHDEGYIKYIWYKQHFCQIGCTMWT